MNRLQADLKKGLFAEGEKSWDKHKTKLGINTTKPDETSAQPASTAQSATTPPTTTPSPPPPPPSGAAPSAAAASIPGASVPLASSTTPVPPPASASEHPIEQPAPTPTNSTVSPPPDTGAQEKKLGGKLKDKLLAKLNDPTVQDKAEQVLKKEAKKKFFGFKF